MSRPNSTWIVTGSTGQLGEQLVQRLTLLGWQVHAMDRASLDITDAQAVSDAVDRLDPAYVVNAAAFTDVDRAELSPALAQEVNALGAANLASAVSRHPGMLLVQVSTDYVFGQVGIDGRPWAEGDLMSPLNAYGLSKAQGESEVRDLLPERGLVVRTAWLYSAAHANFVATMVSRAVRGEPSQVVDDQWGQPTWARDAADLIIELAVRVREQKAPPGNYHASNSGQATWFELARRIYARVGSDPGLVTPLASGELSGTAPRPRWSVLGHEAWSEAGMSAPRPWADALDDALPRFITLHRESSRREWS